VGVTRREIVLGGGAAVFGAVLEPSAQDDVGRRPGPLPFYGGAASAIRPDLLAPSCAGGTVHWSGSRAGTRVALTFDDGPDPTWTPRVLEALAAEDVVATFFVRGDHVRDHGSVHAASVGHHEIANHTFDHPDLARLDHAAVADQIRRCSQQVEDTYGVSPRLFRPPYGHIGGATVLAASEAGLPLVFWSAQLREASFVDHPDGLVADVVRQAHPGVVVLAHDFGPPVRELAIARLRPIIAALKHRGYVFSTVSQLLQG
jgi:peptidoglycan/xylan/chitin deacetylase (PgdA/CDA1 family)